MSFSKEEYWKNRNNREPVHDEDGKEFEIDGEVQTIHKPLRGQGEKLPKYGKQVKESDVTIGFDNMGQVQVQNRKFRRQRYRLPNDVGQVKVKRKKK